MQHKMKEECHALPSSPDLDFKGDSGIHEEGDGFCRATQRKVFILFFHGDNIVIMQPLILTKSEIEANLHMEIDDYARLLGVEVPRLKQECKKMGICLSSFKV